MRNALEVYLGHRLPWNVRTDFEELFDRALQTPWSLTTDSRPAARELFEPAFDVEEQEGAHLLSIDLPGIPVEELKMEMTDGVLTVRGERKRETREDGRTSRFFGTFERKFAIPKTVDETKIEANLENGVLLILMPKKEVAKPRSIEIQSGRNGFFSKLIGLDSKRDQSTEASRDSSAG